jgi:hypothetical protein
MNKEEFNMKKRILLVLMLIVLIVLSVITGCSKNDSAQKGNPSPAPSTITSNPTAKPSTPIATPIPPEVVKKLKVVPNKNLTLTLKKEKHVVDGQIYVQNGMTIGVIIMDKGATVSYAKTIGQKYLKLIKKKYKNTRISIQIVSGGKNLYNIDTKK